MQVCSYVLTCIYLCARVPDFRIRALKELSLIIVKLLQWAMYVEESMNSQIQITFLLKWTWKIICTFCFAEELDSSAAIDGWDNNSRILLEHPYCVCIWHALHTSLGSESSHGRSWGSFEVRGTPMVYCKMILSMIGYQSFLSQLYLMLIPPPKASKPLPTRKNSGSRAL